jgi:hypothetical protein
MPWRRRGLDAIRGQFRCNPLTRHDLRKRSIIPPPSEDVVIDAFSTRLTREKVTLFSRDKMLLYVGVSSTPGVLNPVSSID